MPLSVHGVEAGVLPDDATLTEATLIAAYISVPCASVLVVGGALASLAIRIINERDQETGEGGDLAGKLRVVVSEKADPDYWELF